VATNKEIMNWVVTGSRGQLGSVISKQLSSHGIICHEWNRSNIDLLDEYAVNTRIREIKPRIIVNCAAWTNVESAESNFMQASLANSHVPAILAKASKEIGARFVQISTDYVFSGQDHSPYSIFHPPKPINVYGKTKAAGEQNTLEIYPEGSYVFRTAWLYGPTGGNFCKNLLSNYTSNLSQITVVNDQVGQPTYTLDLAKQIIMTILKDLNPGIYHATNAGQASWFEFEQELFRVAGQDPSRITPISSEQFNSIVKRPKYSVLSNESWHETEIAPMRHWKSAIESAVPLIMKEIKIK
jgi:dTDP-4-dehydrorhamnose reductase